MTHRQGVALRGESVGRHPLLDGDLRLDSRLTPCDDGFEPVREVPTGGFGLISWPDPAHGQRRSAGRLPVPVRVVVEAFHGTLAFRRTRGQPTLRRDRAQGT